VTARLGNSVARTARLGYGAFRVVVSPHRWQLWTYRPRVVCWVLGWELVVAGALMLSVWLNHPVQARQWWTFAALLAGATIHHYVTKPGEERRFAANAPGEHIELTSLWLAPGAVLLSVPQLAMLVLVVRGQRWMIARKNMTQFAFATTAIGGSMLATHQVMAAVAGPTWLSISLAQGQLRLPAALAAGLVAYYLTQTVMVPGVRVLSADSALTRADLIAALGNRTENAQELGALTLAAGFTALAAWSPVALVFAVPVAIAATVLIEREARAVQDAGVDPKTGLANARGWRPGAQRAVSLAGPCRPTALLMIDLDGLKQLNSRLGHVGADAVIAAAAGVLRTTTRPGDILGRWGGDEFVALLPNTDAGEAIRVAERIRAEVAALRLPVTAPAGGDTWIVGVDIPAATVTIGVGSAPDHGNDLDDVIAYADKLLLEGKEHARNTVYATAGLAALPMIQPTLR